MPHIARHWPTKEYSAIVSTKYALDSQGKAVSSVIGVGAVCHRVDWKLSFGRNPTLTPKEEIRPGSVKRRCRL